LHLDTANESRTVTVVQGSGTSILVLTFDGNPVSLSETATMNIGVVMRDLAFNNFDPVTGQIITDGQSPQVISAQITGDNQITIVFSESIPISFSSFANFELTAGGPRSITSVGTSGIDTVILGFNGEAAVIGDTGIIDILPLVTDSAGNSIDGIGTVITDGREAPLIAAPVITIPANGATITTSTVAISGTSEANATIEIFHESTTSLGTATADSSGNWTFTTGTLADGSHSFTATASDGVNTSVASSAVTVTINTVPPPSSFTAWTQAVIDLRASKSASFQSTFPISTDAEVNTLLAWAGNPTAQTNNAALDEFGHMYSPMKRWNERADLQSAFPEASLGADEVKLVTWAGRDTVLANPGNSDLVPHEETYILLRIYFLERDDLRNNDVFNGADDASDPSRLYCWAASSVDSRLTPHQAFYTANCVP